MEATRPELLARILALKVPATQVCRLAGLSVQFVPQMKLGKCQRATPESWRKLEEVVANLEVAERRVPSGPQAPTGALNGPRVSPEDKAVDDLAAAITDADTLDKWIQVQRTITRLSALRIIDPSRTRVLNEAVARGQQLFRAKAEDEERAHAGEEMVVVVRYIDTWRKK